MEQMHGVLTIASHETERTSEKLPAGEEISPANCSCPRVATRNCGDDARLIVGRQFACPHDRIRDLGGEQRDRGHCNAYAIESPLPHLVGGIPTSSPPC